VLDRDDVLWLTREHYQRNQPLSHHAQHLPREVRWYADPSGAADICELKRAGFAISAAKNALRPGIAPVTARLHSGRLKVLPGACPNLLSEAELYRYSDDATNRRAESPVDEDNHALAALRYLVLALDGGRSVRTGTAEKPEEQTRKKEERERQQQRAWLSVWNQDLWTRLFLPSGQSLCPPCPPWLSGLRNLKLAAELGQSDDACGDLFLGFKEVLVAHDEEIGAVRTRRGGIAAGMPRRCRHSGCWAGRQKRRVK
jgi:hypothetical protein